MKKANSTIKTVKFYLTFSKVKPLNKSLFRPSTAEKLSWIVAAILVLLPFHALLTTWAGSNLGHLDLFRIWKEIILTLILPLAAYLAWTSPQIKHWLLNSWVTRLFGVYILLHAILGVWALLTDKTTGSAVVYSLIVNLRFVGFWLICAVLAARSDFLEKHWQKILIIPAAVVIIFGIFQALALPMDFLRHFGYGPETIPAFQTVDSKPELQRIQSTLRGANPLGAYLVLIIPAVLLIVRQNRIFQVGLLIGAIYGLYYTYSRSAWLGLGLALITLLVMSRKIKLTKQLLAAGVLAALIVLAGTLQFLRTNQSVQDALLHTSQTSNVAVTSNEARLSAMRQGASDVTSEPLGRGPGTAGPASFRNEGHQPRISENYFLQIGQEVGILGMAMIAAIMFLVAKELWQRRDDNLARILLASFIGLTFINLISHAWTDDTLSYLFWGLAGIACAPTLVKPKR
ncbi:MAG: hypothetical protein UX30_C0001G0039 [Candidatus Saccharibacteria bacterium GW2011_GWA2_46_10]|nr:MAG: hypothetical protein UX30_C0001G0039 [Candidatus Saccharibacteria bacterium GW2011_GWA2_46_10]